MFLTHPQSKLSSKGIFFDLPNIEQFCTIDNNPHHWLTTDVLQNHHFQYQFVQNLTLNASTKEQFQIYSLFLRKFFRHNYHLIWRSKFQSACINFPQQFTNDEFLPFKDNSDNHHPQFCNLFEFPPLVPISPTLPMTLIVLIKALTVPLLFVLMQNKTLFLLPSTPLLMFLYKLFPPLQM